MSSLPHLIAGQLLLRTRTLQSAAPSPAKVSGERHHHGSTPSAKSTIPSDTDDIELAVLDPKAAVEPPPTDAAATNTRAASFRRSSCASEASSSSTFSDGRHEQASKIWRGHW